MRPFAAFLARAARATTRRAGPARSTGTLRLVGAGFAGAALCGLAMLAALELWNLAATRGHPRIIFDAIARVRDASITVQSWHVVVPEDYAPALTSEGARLYQEHCATCHGAPGIAPAPLALGMNPLPTPIVAAARARPAREVYWLVKNGLRMTGMPAWDVRLSESEIWTVTAFAEALPDISPARYKAFLEELDDRDEMAAPTPQGPAEATSAAYGRRAIRMYGCHGCHEIPGVSEHGAFVGPPLIALGEQAFIAGVLENTRLNLERWLMAPQHHDPLTAMPDLGVTREHAEAMASYLLAAPAKGAARPDEDRSVPSDP